MTPEEKEGCVQYDSCKKQRACTILGECVFGHRMIAEYHTQEPKTVLHYAAHTYQIANVFRKIERGEMFRGEQKRLEYLRKHTRK